MNKYFVESDKMVDKALKILGKYQVLSGDTETNGFDPYTNKLWSVQLGTPEESFMFPYNALSTESRKKLGKFTADKTIIFHNAKFDAKFLKMNGFEINSVWCTQEAERVIYAGKYFTFGLKDLLLRYFQVEMSKTIREDFYNGVFEQRVKELGNWGAWTDEYIEYALEDIVYLHDILEEQQKASNELGLQELLDVEARLPIALAKMELRGVWLDEKAVKKFESKVEIRRDELEVSVSQQLGNYYSIRYVREHAERMKIWDEWKAQHEIIKAQNNQRDPENRRKKTEEAKRAVADSELLKPYPSPPKIEHEFNIQSPKQLKMALEEALGIPLSTTSKEWMEDNIDIHPVMRDLVEFRKFQKLAQFCKLTEDINPVTGKIHANFKQNGTRAGRMSCSEPNLQQIPARTDEAKEFRALFKASKGYKFVGADYSGIELVIIANASNETILIDAINREDDIHCFTMSNILNTTYDNLVNIKKGKKVVTENLQEFNMARNKFESDFYMPALIEKETPIDWVSTFRDYTKTITYGLAYGLSAWGLSKKFHCEYIVAEAFINRFFNVYPRIKRFLKQVEELSYQRRYAVNPLGRRRWFSYPKRKTPQEIEKQLIKEFDQEKRLWDSISDAEWDKKFREAVINAEKEYEGKIRSIKRQAGNFFPQSLCAEMIKIATVEFEEAWGNRKGGLILSVHDELIGEFLEKDVPKAKALLEKVMTESAQRFLNKINVKVEAQVMDVWEKG